MNFCMMCVVVLLVGSVMMVVMLFVVVGKDFVVLVVLFVVLLVFVLGVGVGLNDVDLMDDVSMFGDILIYGMGFKVQCYSIIMQINDGNVVKMVFVFLVLFGGEKQCGQELQLIVYGGMIYVIGFYLWMFVFDVKIGEEKWQYDVCLFDGIMLCCDVVNCGVVIYGDKVIFVMFDVYMVVFNWMIGKVIWNKMLQDYVVGYFNMVVLIIVYGKVIYGNFGGEFGVIGKVEVCDVNIGELVWLCLMIEGNMGLLNGKDLIVIGKINVSWQGDQYKIGGGVLWFGGIYDFGINLICFGIGNFVFWNSYLWFGDNFYILLMLVFDFDIGEIKWYY